MHSFHFSFSLSSFFVFNETNPWGVRWYLMISDDVVWQRLQTVKRLASNLIIIWLNGVHNVYHIRPRRVCTSLLFPSVRMSCLPFARKGIAVTYTRKSNFTRLLKWACDSIDRACVSYESAIAYLTVPLIVATFFYGGEWLLFQMAEYDLTHITLSKQVRPNLSVHV